MPILVLRWLGLDLQFEKALSGLPLIFLFDYLLQMIINY